MAGAFFNRQISFDIETRELSQGGGFGRPQAGPVRSLASFFDNRIDVSLNKDSSHESPNSGSVTIYNISVDDSKAFISLTDPLLTTYTLRAGYGEDRQELPIISQGYIVQTDWNHQGGDSNITFSISEGSKLLRNMLRLAPKEGLSGKRPLSALLDKLRNLGQEIEIIPSEEDLNQEIKKNESEASGGIVPQKSTKQLLSDLLGQNLYDWFIDSGKIVIYKKSTDEADDLINYRANKIINLSFSTGLLSADAETTVDSEFGYWIPWLAFRSLFIPDILPKNVVKIKEELYPHLEGEYAVQDCAYSLTNKAAGDFTVSGRALPLDYRTPAGVRTVRDLLNEARRQEGERRLEDVRRGRR